LLFAFSEEFGAFEVANILKACFDKLAGFFDIFARMPLAGTLYVEMPAVMAKYNLFAEKAGMQKIAEQPPPKEALAIAETLRQLGFDIQLLGSEKYVLNKLQTLSDESLEKLREAFIKHRHAHFMKYFFCHMHFGKKSTQKK